MIDKSRVVVKKSRGKVFAGTWYILAFGKCFRRRTWTEAIRMAISVAPQHVKWFKESKRWQW